MNFTILTLNPGIDRIIYLPIPARMGTLNRAARTVVSQGSKGANVSIILKTLGAEPCYLTVTGGDLGALSESFTASRGISSRFTEAACGVRMNVKIIDSDGICTEFNERGGPLTQTELDSLLAGLDGVSGDDNTVILTGSIPQGVDTGVYERIIKKLKRRGCLTVLDCDGEAMRRGLCAGPSLIKPNKRELAGILGATEQELSDRDVIDGCLSVHDRYGCDILCTLDGDGSVACVGGEVWRVSAAPVPLRGFTGAGDTYLAAYLYRRYVAGDDTAEALKYASAAASAKVALEGTTLPGINQIENRLSAVSAQKLN